MKEETLSNPEASETPSGEQVVSDALFSPFPPTLENVELGKYYIWSRNGNLEVVRAHKDWEVGEGLECMVNDFPSRDFWPFEDDLVGCLYGPIYFSENTKDIPSKGSE